MTLQDGEGAALIFANCAAADYLHSALKERPISDLQQEIDLGRAAVQDCMTCEGEPRRDCSVGANLLQLAGVEAGNEEFQFIVDRDETAEALRAARASSSLTQEQLACRAGLSRSHIASLELGKRTITPEVQLRLQLALLQTEPVPGEKVLDPMLSRIATHESMTKSEVVYKALRMLSGLEPVDQEFVKAIKTELKKITVSTFFNRSKQQKECDVINPSPAENASAYADTTPPIYLSPAEVAHRFRVDPKTVSRWDSRLF